MALLLLDSTGAHTLPDASIYAVKNVQDYGATGSGKT
eukprot:COSAG01_NODE_41692_length_448_cov_1.063037_2_plen_36_part_01